ncbi:MAG: hypothetical protein MJ074_09630 [Oscillospiraceae bacterium]|nr:hypothetical protein [Oscillospiraceae bacterium]
MALTRKENYLRLMRGEIPEFVPSAAYDPYSEGVAEELLTPQSAPEGSIITSFGVEYVGCPTMGMGAMPAPGKYILPDITQWEKYIKKPDVSDRNWEKYYMDQAKNFDRENKALRVGGGDYWLTAVSFMGFEATMMAMYEEPEALKDMLSYVSEFYLEVLKKQIYYLHPEVLGLMDDDAALDYPFFSPEMYREFYRPLQQKHIDIAKENNMVIDRHDCGRCEDFIPDWIEMGIQGWGPAQTTNDLKAIKKKYTGKLVINGGWEGVDNTIPIPELKDKLLDFADTFLPGGSFIWGARVTGNPTDPATIERNAVLKDFYYDYVRDYYKTH